MVAKSNDIKSVQALRIVYIVFWLPNSLPCRPTDTEARIVKIKANGFIVFVPKYGSLPSNLLCGLNVMPFVVFTPFSNQVRHKRAHLPYSKGRQRWWLGSRWGAPESKQAQNKHQLACSYIFLWENVIGIWQHSQTFSEVIQTAFPTSLCGVRTWYQFQGTKLH